MSLTDGATRNGPASESRWKFYSLILTEVTTTVPPANMKSFESNKIIEHSLSSD
jgi:hypothetical protein